MASQRILLGSISPGHRDESSVGVFSPAVAVVVVVGMVGSSVGIGNLAASLEPA